MKHNPVKQIKQIKQLHSVLNAMTPVVSDKEKEIVNIAKDELDTISDAPPHAIILGESADTRRLFTEVGIDASLPECGSGYRILPGDTKRVTIEKPWVTETNPDLCYAVTLPSLSELPAALKRLPDMTASLLSSDALGIVSQTLLTETQLLSMSLFANAKKMVTGLPGKILYIPVGEDLLDFDDSLAIAKTNHAALEEICGPVEMIAPSGLEAFVTAAAAQTQREKIVTYHQNLIGFVQATLETSLNRVKRFEAGIGYVVWEERNRDLHKITGRGRGLPGLKEFQRNIESTSDQQKQAITDELNSLIPDLLAYADKWRAGFKRFYTKKVIPHSNTEIRNLYTNLFAEIRVDLVTTPSEDLAKIFDRFLNSLLESGVTESQIQIIVQDALFGPGTPADMDYDPKKIDLLRSGITILKGISSSGVMGYLSYKGLTALSLQQIFIISGLLTNPVIIGISIGIGVLIAISAILDVYWKRKAELSEEYKKMLHQSVSEIETTLKAYVNDLKNHWITESEACYTRVLDKVHAELDELCKNSTPNLNMTSENIQQEIEINRCRANALSEILVQLKDIHYNEEVIETTEE